MSVFVSLRKLKKKKNERKNYCLLELLSETWLIIVLL